MTDPAEQERAGLHEEVLSAATSQAFGRLGSQAGLGEFYLAGGTGLALHLGHRVSDDLGLFTERPWSWERVAPLLTAAGEVRVDRLDAGTFVGSVAGVRVSLFEYSYVLLREVTPTRFGIPVADVLDIGCMKLVALSQRGSRKDFIDLYHIGQAGYAVEELLRALGRKMPGLAYNTVHILRSLAYFEDADAEPDPVMLMPHDWPLVRRYFMQQADALLDRIEREG